MIIDKRNLSRAFKTLNFCISSLVLLDPNLSSHVISVFGPLIQKLTRPTGFNLLPPVGPAIPLTDIAQLTLNFFWTPSAIDSTTGFETAP